MINQFFNEDCMETMSRMSDDYCTATITSPPYNINLSYKMRHKYGGRIDDAMHIDKYYAWSMVVINELMRVSKYVLWNIQFVSGNKNALLLYMSDLREYIREILIWHKHPSQPAMGEQVLNSDFEFIIIFDKNGGGRQLKYANFERGNMSNVIKTLRHNGNAVEMYGVEHRAVMPISLATILVNNFTKTNDIIYDPFAGVATIPVAAATYGRRFIGSEIDKDVYNAGVKRLNQTLSQSVIFQ